MGGWFPDYPLNMGRYGKGIHTNSNDREFLECADRQNLVITNTLSRSVYAVNVKMRLRDLEDEQIRNGSQAGPQEKWDMIKEANTKAAEEILGHKTRRKFSDPDVMRLSEEQKATQQKRNSATDPAIQNQLRDQRTDKIRKLYKAGKLAKETRDRDPRNKRLKL